MKRSKASEISTHTFPAENVDPTNESIDTIGLTNINISQHFAISDGNNDQDIQAPLTENIIEYLMGHAKQHCPKCFIHHTPHPRWCNKINRSMQKHIMEEDQHNTLQKPNCNKLLGGGRPKIVKPPKIRILSPENKEIYILGTVFRTFKKY